MGARHGVEMGNIAQVYIYLKMSKLLKNIKHLL